MKRILLCLAVTLGLCAGLGASAQAAPAPAAAPTTAAPTTAVPTTRAEAAAAAATLREVERLAPFVDVGTGTVDAAAALAAGVDGAVVRDLRSGLAQGAAHRTAALGLTAEEAAAQLAACAGRTAYYRKLTYVEIWMDSCDVKRLTGIMTAGGGTVALAGAIISLTGIGIPIGAAMAVAGALVAIGSGALTVCDSRSRGVVLDNAGWPCRSQ